MSSTTMMTVGLFVDVNNLFYCLGKKFEGRRLDYSKYYELAKGENMMYRAIAYGTQYSDDSIKFITCLRHLQFETKFRQPIQVKDKHPRKVSPNVAIAMDIVRLQNKLDVVVLGSSEPELVPLVNWIRDSGRKCHILSAGISKELKSVADSWSEITEDLLVIDN